MRKVVCNNADFHPSSPNPPALHHGLRMVGNRRYIKYQYYVFFQSREKRYLQQFLGAIDFAIFPVIWSSENVSR